MSNDNALDGIVGAYHGDNFSIKVIFTTFLGIALYNALELIVLIFITFKRYRGLYFWSLLLSAVLGIIPQSISFVLKYYNLAPLWFSISLSTLGWYFMVTGQALVLLSRLNLVIQNTKVHRRVLAMIIVDAVLLHIPTTVLTYGSNFLPSPNWVAAYTVMERVQLTGFCLQEFILSGLYILETVKILRVEPPTATPGRPSHINRNIMYQLLGINLLIIALDVILLVVEYLNYFVIQTTLKSLVYSIKLKLEFGVLGRLVFLVRSHRLRPEHPVRGSGALKIPDFVDPEYMLSDYTHAPRPAGRVSHPWEDTESKTFVSHIESTARPLPARR
ncbi:hypothetical protein BDV59DRAFT_193160 [Aspergillus ambiguus]|uniref:uncharacterized protein n=1 Tax=Aspergillus ambiguus TaxID=176160 RepID=UPI003CCE1831